MATIHDAFTGGVELGGLYSQADIRIAVCYLLKAINCPISKRGFTDSMQTAKLMNYFEVNDALSYLTANGLIAEDVRKDDAYYSLLPPGAELSERLETDLPTYFRDRAVVVALKVAASERRRQYAHTDIKKIEDGYHAILSLTDGKTLMMQTTVYAPDSLQANAVCASFEDDPLKLYTAIINTITVKQDDE